MLTIDTGGQTNKEWLFQNMDTIGTMVVQSTIKQVAPPEDAFDFHFKRQEILCFYNTKDERIEIAFNQKELSHLYRKWGEERGSSNWFLVHKLVVDASCGGELLKYHKAKQRATS